MVLIVGGYCQGKLDFAKETWGLADADIADGAACEPGAIFQKSALNSLHLLIRRMSPEPLDFFESQMDALRDKIIISDEIGLGVVPIDDEERLWRENVGRVCCLLAQNADEVYRVCAGIPMKIKG